jgi:hypothetical protein
MSSTAAVWPTKVFQSSPVRVYLILIVPSSDPENSVVESDIKAKHPTSFVWPLKTLKLALEWLSHSLTVLSFEDASVLRSGEK